MSAPVIIKRHSKYYASVDGADSNDVASKNVFKHNAKKLKTNTSKVQTLSNKGAKNNVKKSINKNLGVTNKIKMPDLKKKFGWDDPKDIKWKYCKVFNAPVPKKLSLRKKCNSHKCYCGKCDNNTSEKSECDTEKCDSQKSDNSEKCDSEKCDSQKCDSQKCDSEKCDSQKSNDSEKCDSQKSNDSQKCDSEKCNDSEKCDSEKSEKCDSQKSNDSEKCDSDKSNNCNCGKCSSCKHKKKNHCNKAEKCDSDLFTNDSFFKKCEDDSYWSKDSLFDKHCTKAMKRKIGKF
jgi:hypothetical protein